VKTQKGESDSKERAAYKSGKGRCPHLGVNDKASTNVETVRVE